MRREIRWLTAMAAAAALTCFTVAPSARAQDALEADIGVEIDRDADALTDELRPDRVDDDVANTVLVFTNLGGADARVYCVAYAKNGHPVGRAWVKVPGLGQRYILATDFTNRDFIGHAQCGGTRHVKGSAFLVGPAFSDLPVLQGRGRNSRIRFLVVASY